MRFTGVLLGCPFRRNHTYSTVQSPTLLDRRKEYPSPFTPAPKPWPERDGSWESMLTVVDSRGAAVGEASAWAVHTKGLWHRDVYVVLALTDGRVLLQRRAAWKWTYPGMLDFAAAEGMEGNESFASAAARAVREEIFDGGPVRVGGRAFKIEAPRRDGRAAAAKLHRCCGPRTFIWEGQMENMYLKEATIVEVWKATVLLTPTNLAASSVTADPAKKGSKNEVDGFQIIDPAALKLEARTATGKKRYGPWLLDAVEHCPACW